MHRSLRSDGLIVTYSSQVAYVMYANARFTLRIQSVLHKMLKLIALLLRVQSP